jgi:hypothetical protein
MADLKPIGSEKLTGQDKIKRIMEIARFNEVIPQTINETAKSEYSVGLADGNKYEIVKERQGYIIKKTISESETEYIEPIKNRKYYSSYSQALKRLNLVAGELNRLNENDEGISLYGEQKKFTLKTPKPAAEESPIWVLKVRKWVWKIWVLKVRKWVWKIWVLKAKNLQKMKEVLLLSKLFKS